jgi:hypothetical protein
MSYSGSYLYKYRGWLIVGHLYISIEDSGKYLGAFKKYEKKFWRYIRTFEATLVFNTLTKCQWISNEN